MKRTICLHVRLYLEPLEILIMLLLLLLQHLLLDLAVLIRARVVGIVWGGGWRRGERNRSCAMLLLLLRKHRTQGLNMLMRPVLLRLWGNLLWLWGDLLLLLLLLCLWMRILSYRARDAQMTDTFLWAKHLFIYFASE